MSWWSRLANVFRPDRLSRDIDEELQAHIDEAVDRGRDPAEAHRSLGPALRLREESRDMRLLTWLDSLRTDAAFGWRQLLKNKVASAAAILSLALGIGACTGAFRLIDALLLRPLPVTEPDRLYVLARQGIDPGGHFRTTDSTEYPTFQLERAAVKDQAELIAVSYADRADLTYGSDEEMEKAHRQFVSGWMFESFGLRPTLGRLLATDDDLKPHAHAYAVLSYGYWKSRFGRDPKIVGRTFRMGNDLCEIVGVGPEGFTGTEPGTAIDIFLPTMMNPGVTHADWSWFRTFVKLKAGVAVEPVREKLAAINQAVEEETVKRFVGMPKQRIEDFLHQKLVLEPAAAGVSAMQDDYRASLAALEILVALVLLIACANVANLMTAQAAARAREMALRVSIGAGRARLLQLVMVEAAWIGVMAAGVGFALAWWSAPFIVSRINPPGDPARLFLPADWRVLGFGLILIVSVMLLFGLAPALRASAVQPLSALKGGDDPHSRRRLMRALIGVQTAFCFLVLFVAGLFMATFERLSNRPTGFSADRLLNLDTIAQRPQPSVYWDQVAQRLRELPGVETVALSNWPILSGNGAFGYVSTNGAPPSGVLAYFMYVSPGWLDAMKIPLLDGRDFRPEDVSPRVAIVNREFAEQFFAGADPVGKWFGRLGNPRVQIVGLVPNALYQDMREPAMPAAYYPFQAVGDKGALQPIEKATFIVRTAASNPLTLASTLRREIPRARPEFRVSNIRTQSEIDQSHTVRERLLSGLAFFFGAVALLLAGVGLYGVLDYSVLQRRREMAIRMALGARAGHVARRVTAHAYTMVIAGALGGLALGFASARSIESLLYQVKPSDPRVLALPALTILAVALLAALPPVIRAVRIEPATMLRAE
jgi:predicted permease